MQRYVLFLLIFTTTLAVAAPSTPHESDSTLLWIDVTHVDIREVLDMIARNHDVNILCDEGISGSVTMRLSGIPMERGLEILAESHNLVVVREGEVYRLKKPVPDSYCTLELHGGRLAADIKSIDIQAFLKEFSEKTSLSIVPEKSLSGTVSGKLYDVPVDEGFNALLRANNFKVVRRGRVYQVMNYAPGSDSRVERTKYIHYLGGLVTLDVSNADLQWVIDEIADQAAIEILQYEKLRGNVNARLNDIPLSEVFALLLGGTDFSYIERNNIVMIGNRNASTPSGRALSKSELITLDHIKASEVGAILPHNLHRDNIKVIKEQNGILVSGTSEDIVKIRDFLATVDIPTPQVVINAVVVEYSRDLSKDRGIEYGLSSSENTTPADNAYAWPYLYYKRKGENARSFLKDIGFNENFVTNLPDNFFLTLRSLESEGTAKVLARPSITVINGNNAMIKVAQRQYFRIITGSYEHQNYQFQPIEFGIELNITPWISQSGQITTEIRPEISNAMGVNTEGYPNVFMRSVSTTVRLDNKETLVLGGLLRSEDQKQHKKVPLLGDIPALGVLFRTTVTKKIETNLVIYITPRIIENNEDVDLRTELERFEKMNRRNMFQSHLSDHLTDNTVGKRDSSALSNQNQSESLPRMKPHGPGAQDRVGTSNKNASPDDNQVDSQ